MFLPRSGERLLLGGALALAAAITAGTPASGQIFCDNRQGCDVGRPPPNPPPRMTPPPPPVIQQPPPTAPPLTVLTTPSPVTPLIPVDVTSIELADPTAFPERRPLTDAPGVKAAANQSWPGADDLGGPESGIVVRARPGSRYDRPTVYVVDLSLGTVLVSVKRPSHLALVKTPGGEVSVAASGDVLVSLDGGVLRVMNVDGRGESVRVRLAETAKIVALAPGFEMVSAARPLNRLDLRPADGIGRRGTRLIEGQRLAVSEFSVESFLNSSEIVVALSGKDAGAQERRILGDMSKMAAVLNLTNGTQGFVAVAPPGAAPVP